MTVWVTGLATVTAGGAAVEPLVLSRHPIAPPAIPTAMRSEATPRHKRSDAIRLLTTAVSTCSFPSEPNIRATLQVGFTLVS